MRTRVHMDTVALDRLFESQFVVEILRGTAEVVAKRIIAPAGLETRARAGKGPQGPYSQAIMRGPRALAVEFGTRRQVPQAPVRRAVHGAR